MVMDNVDFYFVFIYNLEGVSLRKFRFVKILLKCIDMKSWKKD